MTQRAILTYIGNIENKIFPVLFGINNNEVTKLAYIEFVDTQTGQTHKVSPSVDREV